MMPMIDADAALAATAVVGLLKWLGEKSHVDDAEFVAANDFVQCALADADFCRRIKLLTGRDLRSQITPDELMTLASEAELRRWGYQRQ